MHSNRRWRTLFCALGLGAVLATAESASALPLTLFDLNGGMSFTTASGLTFSNFQASVTGALQPDLDQYPVVPQADGFVLSGPLVVGGGGVGNLMLTYDVTAMAPILVGASLSAPGLTIGPGAFAVVGESLFGPASEFLGSLTAYDIEGFGIVPNESIPFGPVSQVSVAKAVNLGSGLFAFSMVPVIAQSFQFIPEPVTMWLLTLGLVGLAWWRPRRMLAD